MSTELALLFVVSLTQAQRPGPEEHARQPQRPPIAARTDEFSCRVERRIPIFTPLCHSFLPGFFCDDFVPYGFYTEIVHTVEFFGPPFGFAPFGVGPFDPWGFGGFAPVYVWPEPVFHRPTFFVPAPAQVIDPRVPARFVQPAVAPGGTTDIPERLIDDLISKRRPNLAQRAQAARLEGAGDRMFQAGHFARAAERYKQALGQTPENDEAKFKRGAALAAAGQYDEAGRVLRDALRDRPDWPFVPHDLRTLFPDEAAVVQTLENLDRESRRPTADNDVPFLRAYVLYFSGQRAAAEAVFRNPPEGGSTTHYEIFQEAIARQRGNR